MQIDRQSVYISVIPLINYYKIKMKNVTHFNSREGTLTQGAYIG